MTFGAPLVALVNPRQTAASAESARQYGADLVLTVAVPGADWRIIA